jgi:hypothetical protein
MAAFMGCYRGLATILKADAFGSKVNPEVESKLQQVVGYHPPIDLEKLNQYPKGSFGWEYAQHMKTNHLKLLTFLLNLKTLLKKRLCLEVCCHP